MTDIVTDLLRAEARRDVTSMAALLADDVVFEMPFAEPPSSVHGREALQKLLEEFLHGFYTEFTLHDIEVTPAHENGKYFAEYNSTGKAAAKDHEYRQRYAAVFQVHDGKITTWREYFNPLPLRAALA
ncbi:nuclear transport factor 2 family protein [Actinomadura chibensis]|uniref:Nuclear transport factor 2 family protein n=1 Tax=Actinomadura chibensis TaxID=392828 RepID=A0A5D0NU20_9ACTN|nr:nuclear transport factor 2 family protein [Actinomadura chibensis]TYB47855.1 nuclear transport factor 2 family protein [Actinomadura chibensis]